MEAGARPSETGGRARTLHAPAADRDIVLRGDLPPGLYTVVLPGPEHRTINVRPADPEFRNGDLVLAYLAGPDNEHDYVAFAHVSRRRVLRVWSRFRSESLIVDAARLLAQDPAGAARAYGVRAGRCSVCGRTLTHPTSISRGIGPVCEARFEDVPIRSRGRNL